MMQASSSPVARPRASTDACLPCRAGVGLKPQHLEAVFAAAHQVAFFEVHAENYMGAGGPPHGHLTRIRENWPLSVHGVGLSLAGAERPDSDHLARLRILCDRYQPQSFSEHLAWSRHGATFYNDLLPVAYDAPTLARVASHVAEAQDALGRRMLLENPATYVSFARSTLSEIDFLSEIARITGCGLLLDVNNVYVSATNHGFDPAGYIAAFPAGLVGEIHLAGFAVDPSPGPRLLIDSHGTPVDDVVWQLYAEAVARTGPVPVLIERDNDIPSFDELLAEAAHAERVAARVLGTGASVQGAA